MSLSANRPATKNCLGKFCRVQVRAGIALCRDCEMGARAEAKRIKAIEDAKRERILRKGRSAAAQNRLGVQLNAKWVGHLTDAYLQGLVDL